MKSGTLQAYLNPSPTSCTQCRSLHRWFPQNFKNKSSECLTSKALHNIMESLPQPKAASLLQIDIELFTQPHNLTTITTKIKSNPRMAFVYSCLPANTSTKSLSLAQSCLSQTISFNNDAYNNYKRNTITHEHRHMTTFHSPRFHVLGNIISPRKTKTNEDEDRWRLPLDKFRETHRKSRVAATTDKPYSDPDRYQSHFENNSRSYICTCNQFQRI